MTGNADTATKLATARNINGVKFDGSVDISIPTITSRGRVTALTGTTQGAATGLQMYEAYNNGYPSAYGNVLHLKGATAVGEGELFIGWSGTSGAHAPVHVRSRRDTDTASWSEWAQVYTSKDSIPGVNTTGNQNTTGNAASATKLQTARTIGGVSFNGTANIDLPGVNKTGNQSTTGNAATATKLQTARTINGVSFDGTANISLSPANIGCPASPTGWLVTGDNGASITTEQLVTLLRDNGAFNAKAWIARCAWAYANSASIPDSETGCGIIPLAGAVIEVFSNNTNNYTIRITTATTTSVSGALTNAEFIYVSNGTSYSPGWRRAYNTKNKPTAADVGALPLSGGALTGGLTAAGEIISKSANGLRIAYGNYGFFIRNDGSNTYFMLTDSGNSLGTYNRLRPLIINNANGAVTIGNGLNVTGGINGSLNGNAATATKLQTARTIGGVSFDGSANINLPGVNIAGNQNTTGNAATATKLQTACTINGVSFDGSKNIELTAEDLNLEQTVELAAGSLQKNQNGADIPDKDRFLSNINVYSKGEVDKKKGMRQYAFNAPSNAVGGKWYPVIFRRSTGSTGELASRVIITTTSAGGNYEMNNCEFNGMVMPGGWTDRGSYAAGYFSTYQPNERAIHSIVTSLKEDDVCSVFYVEGRAFPVRVSAEEGLTVIVPTQDYTVGQTTYKWGATNPATESTNAQAILDFNNGRGFYCSHSIFGINAIFSGNLGIGTANALGGNSIVLGDNDTGFKQNGDGVLDAYANGVHVFRFRNGSAISLKGIQTGESKLFTLSSSNTAARNASFNLWGNSSRPTVAELGDDSGWHFYSQRNTDNSVIFSVNGQIQPNNWGNFDSRYVKDVRLGTRVVQLMARGGRYEKAGHAITGLRIIGEVDGDDEAIFRPIQKYINGTWYNVAQV
ncbi:phage tail protein [Shigella boydii]|uniref:phage tail fiber protein n=1 Tax=Shigella boydii TaxID=621 RepID=UPI002092BB19|nr:phage tail protein [Shigella boydii]